MVKYRCVKADRIGGVYLNARTYIEDGIQDARRRAMNMIHGDKVDTVLIYLDSDYRNKPWVGYLEKVVLLSKNQYASYTRRGFVELKPNGAIKKDVM